ncbi:helix-turn-helix domain-containing protein [Arthrobacter bambusae]|uniref:helix-turn-helix domain-containing protein n=1 Tax=Arthrobacter bambusae TaxID=1338426 RepID=UPI0027897E8B|nr:helix-turn-helix domain-containing protein [Arthrobacter bambusae]MDQ0212471.1 hypothetical protein [Arthrobacter bambusae]MDQ0236919.1 hypothetical protein [Arthrobacter bambusae]
MSHVEGKNLIEDAQWQRIIERLAGQVPELAENFLGRILLDPAYSESGLTLEDLRSSSEKCFNAMLESLAKGGTDMSSLELLAAELGAKRAQQGIPLESLVRAIRTDFSVLWEALSAPSLGVNPGLLVRKTELVWQVVDTFAVRVKESYVAEAEDLETATADLQHQYLTKLLAAAEPSPSDMLRIAGALKIDPGAEFLVAAISRDDSLMLRRRLGSLSAPRAVAGFAFDQGHHTIVILQRKQGLRLDLAFDERALFEGLAAGVAPIAQGIAGVRMAVLAAREIMADLAVGETGVFRLEDRWESVTRYRLAQVGCDPAFLVDPYLRRCSPGERQRLLETVTVFLDSGSLLETSAILGCHRNTIVNRLASFEKYTGLDLQMPRGAAIAFLALSKLRSPDSGRPAIFAARQ